MLRWDCIAAYIILNLSILRIFWFFRHVLTTTYALYLIDTKVWIDMDNDPEGECYRRGTILKVISADTVNIKYEDNHQKPHDIKGNKVFPVNSYNKLKRGYDDMVEMENLSEAELLYNLRMRYKDEFIFTYVGPTLIVLNPYKPAKHLFTPEILKEFQDSVRK